MVPLPPPVADRFKTAFEAGRLASVRCADDARETEYLAEGRTLGEVDVAYRRGAQAWQTPETSDVRVDPDGRGRSWRAGDLRVASRFREEGGRLRWTIQVDNVGENAVELGGLVTPLPMRTRFGADSKSAAVLKHSFVSGAGSFLFWMRKDSAEPYLTMMPARGTAPEYWSAGKEGFRLFAHSASEVDRIRANGGSWRLPHTSRLLAPGRGARYAYAFEWARGRADVRDRVARDGGLDVQVAPGMTVPSDLSVDVALRSAIPVRSLEAEHPGETLLRPIGARKGYRLYRVRFRRPGENRLTVVQRDGGRTYLEFFACAPVETLLKKRAAFLARSQVRDRSKWYDGLLREWNMASRRYLSPDDYDRIRGWRIYEVTCDDPGLGKPAFLAAKNAEYPVQAEVTALDRYIDRFVWGGLQQTDREPYPYAIYGIPDWKTLRTSRDPDRKKGVDHVWRPYDYPHVALLYLSMYRIARSRSVATAHDAREYLRRAGGTAIAMFEVPKRIAGWSADETGFYNETIVPELIDRLRQEGMRRDADRLQAHWDRKVRTFVAGKVDLFASEYAFDSTGFESTGAIAVYAKREGRRLGLDARAVAAFRDRQMADNLFCRGTVEPAYYLLGSDYRGGGGDAYTLSYMAPMGGGAVLDYGLHDAVDGVPFVRLGYQSFLSSLALINAGTSASAGGSWYPGAASDGAAGGGFEPAAYGRTWLDQPHGRGSWYYSCESDLGFCGTLRAARTTIVDDPIFGRFTYGGTGISWGSQLRFTPLDGVRRRLSLRTAETDADLEAVGTRFLSGRYDAAARRLRLRCEPNPRGDASIEAVRRDGGRVVRRFGPHRTAWSVVLDLSTFASRLPRADSGGVAAP